MKRWLLGSFVFALVCTSARGQNLANRGLTLTGTVVAVNPRAVVGSDKEKYEFEVDLLLNFRNDSKSPIIILNPDKFYGTKKIAFLENVSPVSNSELSSSSIVWKNPYPNITHTPIDDLVRELSWRYEYKAPPSQYYFVVIDAESAYECRASFTVPNGFRVKKLLEENRPPKLSVIPDYPALRVSYYFSLRNRSEHPNLLEKTQQAFKKFGQLPLDSNGDFNVRSEIIVNRPPDS